MDQTLRVVANKEREEIKGTTKQKMARRLSKGGDALKQECVRQNTTEGIDGALHPSAYRPVTTRTMYPKIRYCSLLFQFASVYKGLNFVVIIVVCVLGNVAWRRPSLSKSDHQPMSSILVVSLGLEHVAVEILRELHPP